MRRPTTSASADEGGGAESMTTPLVRWRRRWTRALWVVPVSRAGEYPAEVFVREADPSGGPGKRKLYPEGSFVYRLSGRDRQRSASYYTPEVLTRLCGEAFAGRAAHAGHAR